MQVREHDVSSSDQETPQKGVFKLNKRIERWGRYVMDPLEKYHHYGVEGLENVPRTGRVILVVNHSLATYDGFMLGLALLRESGRSPVGLGDDLIFKIPGLATLAREVGIFPASPTTGEELLHDEYMVAVAPGGMRESLRPSSEKYQVRWDKRKGFIRLALKTQSPILLAACPAADNMYTIYENDLTKLAYRHLKVPIPLAFGRGGTLFPKKVTLTHYIHPLLYPPVIDESRFDEQVDEFHALVVQTMESLLRRRS